MEGTREQLANISDALRFVATTLGAEADADIRMTPLTLAHCASNLDALSSHLDQVSRLLREDNREH